MRPLEALLLLVLLPICLILLSGRSFSPPLRALPAVALFVCAAHLAWEGQRWQLWPAYAATLVLFLLLVWPGQSRGSLGLGFLASGAALAAFLFGSWLPVFRLPPPTGSYPIGTTIRHLIDHARPETQGPSPHGRRELVVQIWYPAAIPGPPQPYRKPVELEFIKSHFALVQTHASRDVPAASSRDRFPILLFCPSWTGRRNQNTLQAEALASHGFVVVGIDHPYGSELTVFPDGRRVPSTVGEMFDFSSDSSLERSLLHTTAQLATRAADARFVLDELERLDQHDPGGILTGRLDTRRVGIFGHSFGGSVAVEVCRQDPRFKAAANLDGYLLGETLSSPLQRPTLHMYEDVPAPTRDELSRNPTLAGQYRLFARQLAHLENPAGESASQLVLEGASHMNYCDSGLYSPLRRISRSGRIDPSRAATVINHTLLAFFDQTLAHDTASNRALVLPPDPELRRFDNDAWMRSIRSLLDSPVPNPDPHEPPATACNDPGNRHTPSAPG
jgi:predicted dienelactone hydrolase